MRFYRAVFLSLQRLFPLWGDAVSRIAITMSRRRPRVPSLSRRRLLLAGSVSLVVVLMVLAGFGWNTNSKATAVQQDIANILDRLGDQALQDMADPEEYARLGAAGK